MPASAPKRYYVYMVASRTRVLYTGITSHLERRMYEHKQKSNEGFTATYACNRLVWYEEYSHPQTAIAREKQLKSWRREKKLALIEQTNPTWTDLSELWGRPLPRPHARNRTTNIANRTPTTSASGRNHLA